MAKKYDWGDGNGAIHTIPLDQHQSDLRAQATQRVGNAQTQAVFGNWKPGMTNQQAATLANAVPGAPAPAAPAAAPSSAPTSGGPAQIVPDAQYLAEAAQRAFERTTKINSITDEGKNDRSDTQRAIDRLLEQAVNDRSTLSTNANKEGLFYSGQLTKRLGDYEKALTRNTGDQTTALGQREDARTAAMKALQQGAPLEEADALIAAGARQVSRDTAAADVGSLVAPANTPAVTPIAPVTQLVNRSTNVRAGQAYTPVPGTRAGASGTWHVYNGRRVWVPARR